MKKYILLALFVAFGLSQFVPSFDVFSESSSSSSSTGQYTRKADQVIKTYVTRLEKSGFSNSDIIATLEKVKAVYVKKKSESNYTGSKKITIDAIINALEKAINERKGQDNNDEDLYDLFNTIPTTTTTVTNTYYSGTTNTNCTTEYAPVCGVKTSSSSCTPDGRCYVSDGMVSTYTNKCELLKAKATYLYSGACKTTIDPPSTPMCSTGTFTNSSCICKDGKSPRMVDSGTRVQMYTCEAVPVKLPPVTTCGKGIFYTGDCLCSNGKSPIVIAKNSIGQQAYSCDPTMIITPPACTKEYAPVCATPKSNCTSTYCTDVMPQAKTYDNKCMMDAAGANYLYSGTCKGAINPPICATGTLTESSCTCKDGTSPRPIASGTRIQAYTCDPVVVTPPACTKEYAPVCAQMPRTSVDCAAGSTTCTMPPPQTYDNKCMMNSAGASYLYGGVCKTETPVPVCATGAFSSSSCICKDGSSPRVLESGTRIQAYTCDPIVVTTCGADYAPVCGQFTPVCPTGMACLLSMPVPTTYTNKCELLKARATFLYSGACTSDM